MTAIHKSNQGTFKPAQVSDSVSRSTESGGNLLPAIVMRFLLQDHAGVLLPQERVAWCLKRTQPGKRTVEIYKVTGGTRATYKNLIVCGSIWNCPVCASRVTEKRRVELAEALRVWGGSMVMVTYTMRHNRRQSLETLLTVLRQAYRRTKSGRQFQYMRKRWGWAGSVRTLEVTYGMNGWHVHIHELVFIKNRRMTDSRVDALKHRIFTLWSNALQKERMDVDIVHGIHVETANSAIRDYVAKFGHEPITTAWDASAELTKNPAKIARREGKSPLALLHDSYTGNRRATALWLEYAGDFKGINQLVWSRGCRAMLGLADVKPDAEVAEEIPEEFEPFLSITQDDWIAIRKTRKRGELLHYAATHDAEETARFITDVSNGYWTAEDNIYG